MFRFRFLDERCSECSSQNSVFCEECCDLYEYDLRKYLENLENDDDRKD